ncbi:unnamed protein product [Spirodela intermedia]|uniref:Uncharacterized protein n=1 Tax=Spirodela intermedia TaxID=51605 RepID=A0A7I8JXF8_SPIIN|nr:unnamed protein product [Spirodela intermedia]
MSKSTMSKDGVDTSCDKGKS